MSEGEINLIVGEIRQIRTEINENTKIFDNRFREVENWINTKKEPIDRLLVNSEEKEKSDKKLMFSVIISLTGGLLMTNGISGFIEALKNVFKLL